MTARTWFRAPGSNAAGRACAAVAAITGLTTGGCAPGPPGAGPVACTAARFAAPYQHVDPCDAEAVMLACAATVFTHAPAATAPGAGVRAAAVAGLLDPGYYQQLQPAAGLLDPAAAREWESWREHRVRVAAAARISASDHPPDHPPGKPLMAARIAVVTQQPSDHTPAQTLAVYLSAARTSPAHPWRITRIDPQ